jgi:hypothetical protein
VSSARDPLSTTTDDSCRRRRRREVRSFRLSTHRVCCRADSPPRRGRRWQSKRSARQRVRASLARPKCRRSPTRSRNRIGTLVPLRTGFYREELAAASVREARILGSWLNTENRKRRRGGLGGPHLLPEAALRHQIRILGNSASCPEERPMRKNPLAPWGVTSRYAAGRRRNATAKNVARGDREWRLTSVRRRASAACAHSPTDTYFTSRYSCIAYLPPSRPKPEAFIPPNGACAVEGAPSFTPMTPYSRRSATRNTRELSRV